MTTRREFLIGIGALAVAGPALSKVAAAVELSEVAAAVEPEIEWFQMVGNRLFAHYTDGTMEGPFTLTGRVLPKNGLIDWAAFTKAHRDKHVTARYVDGLGLLTWNGEGGA